MFALHFEGILLQEGGGAQTAPVKVTLAAGAAPGGEAGGKTVRKRAIWKSGIALCWLAWGFGQSTVHLPTQSRQADFSGFPVTKPARVVTALPGTCAAGEVVAVSGAGAGLYVCSSSGSWVAAAPHGHELNDMAGVSGKKGTGALLQAFGGGAVQAGDCAQFDAEGNLVSANAPCGGGANFSLDFTGAAAVLLNHNLGTRSVLVGCTDASGQAVIPDAARVLDENRVQVDFAVAQAGKCVVNASGGGGGAGAVSSVFGRTGVVTAQAGDYSFSQIAGQLALSQIAPVALQGNGSKLQLFSGTAAANDCAKFDASGNLVSAGAACGTGTGDVTGPAGAADGEVALYQGTTGKLLKRASGTGVARLTNGVLGVVSGSGADCVRADGSSGPCGGALYFGAGLEGSGTAADPVRIAGGGAVASQAFYSASLSFGTLGAASCEELNIAAPGAASGETLAPGIPESLPSGVLASMYSGAGVVVVRLCNPTGTSVAIPDGLSYSVRIIRGF